MSISAQDNTDLESLNLSPDCISYLKEQLLLPQLEKWDNNSLSNIDEQLKNLEKKESLRKIIPTVELNGYNAFFQVDSSLVNNENDFPAVYSSLQLTARNEIGIVPIGLTGQLVALDGKINLDLSNISISFDQDQFLQNLKQKHFALKRPENLLDACDLNREKLNFSEEELNAIIEESQFLAYQKIVSSDAFVEHQLALQSKLDSIQNNISSEIEMVDTTYIKELTTAIQLVQEVESAYEQAWKIKGYRTDALWNSIHSKLQSYSDKLENLDQVDSLRNNLVWNKQVTKAEKYLMNVKQFRLGRFHLHESEFTAQYQLLNGLKYGYESENIFGTIAYGKQISPSPLFYNLGFQPSTNRQFLLASVGVGKLQGNHSSFSYLQVGEKGSLTDTIVIFPKQNRVFAWKGQVRLSDQIEAISEIALSDNILGNIQGIIPENQSTPLIPKSSSKLELGFNPRKTNFQFGLGYFYSGARFKTLGNPFLLTNRQGVHLNAKGNILKNRINLNAQFKYGQSIDENFVDEFKDIQFFGEVRFKLSKQNMLTFSVMPNIFRQGLPETQGVQNENTIYTLQGNFYKQIKNTQAITTLNITNLRSNFQFVDSIQLDNSIYIFLNESIFLSEKQSINASLMIGKERSLSGPLEDLLSQLDYKFRTQKMNFSTGLQLIQDRFYEGLQFGIVNSIQFSIWDNSFFQFYLNYRNHLKQPQFLNPSQLTANLSFQYIITHKKR